MSYFRNQRIPGMVEVLIVINVIFYLIYLIYGDLAAYCALNIYPLGRDIPDGIYTINNGAYWQLLTSMFMHDRSNLMHIAFNMLGLYMFGKSLEMRWGKIRFLAFYLTVGILANAASVVFFLLTGQGARLIGASGAIYGVVLAFGGYYPETILLLFFIIPMKVKWTILLFTGIAIFSEITGSMGGIAHMTHLFGFIFAFFYLLFFFKINAIKEMYFPSRHRFYYDQ